MTPTLPLQPLAISSLAQSAGGATAATTVVIWASVLIIALVGGGFLVMAIRRTLLAKDTPAATGGMMLDDLRSMRRRGQLTDEEYEIARDALTSGLTGRPASAPPPKRPATPARAGGTLVAPPGFDLTGQPLPQPRDRTRPPRPGTPERGGGTGG